MAYEKQTWVPYDDNKTEEENIQNGAVVTAERINHLETGLDEHDKNTTNPHKVTKAQVGLENVTNVEQAPKTDFTSHTSNKTNPHGVTKGQVGLGNVTNVEQASKTEYDSHVADKTNPHSVTKAQVGLGNVDNYSTATQAEAEAGAATNKFMTPVLVFKAIAKWVQGKFVSTTGNETILGTKNFQDGLQVGGVPVRVTNDACWCEDFAVNNLVAGKVNPDIQRFSTSNAEAFSASGKVITIKKSGVYMITLGMNYTGLTNWLTFGISRVDGTSLVNRNLLGSPSSGSNSLTYVRSFEGNDQLTIEFNSGTAGTTMQKINLAIVKLA
ncbi:hypothetical protein P7D52_01410 [Enterococcus dongliensis]|uniref:C1q domain-containing protein n=1 Tax=Enterococcus dongliensis TaxID=2559925 RepID=A0AAW8TDG8_9ENTE|nr:hypothetical protein [Enterococcus dongliensis]MDT2635066.1 hypothetical protein [Enterococcus dongliensis]MDT2636251.1 hypothetical protein [Enterococcus dongliensis]MDT2641473.1 hypothetical protein [Enterococcus dongliensis]